MPSLKLEVLQAFAALNEAIAASGIEHAYLGAFAAIAWGRLRSTSDLDIVIGFVPEDWERLKAELTRRGGRLGKGTGPTDPSDVLPDIMACWIGSAPAIRIDIFLAKTDFEREALATAKDATVFDTPIRVVKAEASVIYKLLASRAKDILDVEAIFEARREAGDMLDWGFLERWAAYWEIADRLAPYRTRFAPQ